MIMLLFAGCFRSIPPPILKPTLKIKKPVCTADNEFVGIVQKAAETRKKLVELRSREIPKLPEGYRGIVHRAMKLVKFNPQFTHGIDIDPAFLRLITFIGTLPAQAVNVRPYPITRLVRLYRRFISARTTLIGEKALHPDPAFQYIWAVVVQGQKPDLKVAKKAFCAQTGQSIKDLQRFATKLEKRMHRLQRLRVAMDAVAIQAYFRLKMDFKLMIIAHPFKAIKRVLRTPKHFAWQLIKAWKADRADLSQAIMDMMPAHPYYKATMIGLKQYRDIAKHGGFVRIPRGRTLKKGMKGKAVIALKKRLAQEGYKVGEITPVFDDTLKKAVKHYQFTHQYVQTGVVDHRVLRSINVSIKRRIRSIKLSLQRWRESNLDASQPFYVRVNIPEFKMEVWDHGKLATKHRVIVGNNYWSTDPIGMVEGRINRTKIFSATIKRIVINPRWHVPDRIKKEEFYSKNVFKEPDYFVKHKFKVKVMPDGTERIFQEAGDENALGRVKFVFPNPYSIFMHDTDEKKLFKNQIRAYSHGCIRLNKPLEVAFYILNHINGMTKKEFDKDLAKEDFTIVKLKTPIPIYVDYNTVSLDPTGKMMFFIDVYQYDRDFYNGKIPYTEKELELLLKKIKKID